MAHSPEVAELHASNILGDTHIQYLAALLRLWLRVPDSWRRVAAVVRLCACDS